MSTVFYSVAGEGRGHAARVRTVVEALRGRHEVVLFASGVAFDFLSDCYRETPVTVRRIPGLLFHYSRGRLDYTKTALHAAKYLPRLPSLIKRLEQELTWQGADLVITDFEPALPRAARRMGIPVISLDHQHFLKVSDLSSLPRGLRWKARMSEPLVSLYCSGQVETIVSSFYFPPLREKYIGKVVQTGVLLRSEVVERTPQRQGHLTVYLRRFAPGNVLESLRRTGREVRIYGLGERPDDGNLRYRPISDRGFLDDLVTCDVLVCTAGNQLVGEAMFLGKPIFALPEPKNFEQHINAHYIRESRGGDWCPVPDVDQSTFSRFLGRANEYRCVTDKKLLHGNPAVMAAIEKHLTAVPAREDLFDPDHAPSTQHGEPATQSANLIRNTDLH